MFKRIFLIIISALFFAVVQAKAFGPSKILLSSERVLSRHTMSLETRYGDKFVNDVFKDNILLTLAYLSGKTTGVSEINWTEIRKPFQYEMVLKPGEVFAFHENILPEYRGKLVKTIHAHFGAQEGFRSDGYLYGDGVCHLASLLNWVAKDANLRVNSPTNHNFANIPEIPKEYGTSIYSNLWDNPSDQLQNLYIENNFAKPVKILFQFSGTKLTISVIEEA